MDLKSCDMPEPTVVDYDAAYYVKDEFLSDITSLKEAIGVKTYNNIIKDISNHSRVFFVAPLNEFVNNLTYIPYYAIAPIMDKIRAGLGTYFAKLPKQEDKTEEKKQ